MDTQKKINVLIMLLVERNEMDAGQEKKQTKSHYPKLEIPKYTALKNMKII